MERKPHSGSGGEQVHVRRAGETDAEAACQVIRRSITELCRDDHRDDPSSLSLWLANKTPENLKAWIGDPENYMLVAGADGAVIGVAAMRGPGRVMLNYVSPAARLRGVSKALMAALEAEARARGFEALTLDSTSTARGFYCSIGYDEAGAPRPGFGVTLRFPMVKALQPRT
jgi:GNAT superfamily N-acetyltransferase